MTIPKKTENYWRATCVALTCSVVFILLSLSLELIVFFLAKWEPLHPWLPESWPPILAIVPSVTPPFSSQFHLSV